MGGLRMKTCLWLVVAFAVLVPSSMQASEEKPISMEAIMEEISLLRTLIAEQQQQIEQLHNALKTAAAPATAPAPVEDPPGAGGVMAVRPQASTAQAEDVSKKLDTLANSLGGFKLSGDFRFRADMQARKGNAVAGPVQNVRSRYRIRLNADKDLDSDFRFHIQLSTGPYNVQTTNDQEFGAMAVKQPFAIAEAFIDYHPSSRLSLRGGRMEEVFADNSRFLWDDDVRFNGFQQTASMALPSRAFNKIEFRAAEYFLSNPNVPLLAAAATSPFVTAGYQPGQKVRDATVRGFTSVSQRRNTLAARCDYGDRQLWSDPAIWRCTVPVSVRDQRSERDHRPIHRRRSGHGPDNQHRRTRRSLRSRPHSIA